MDCITWDTSITMAKERPRLRLRPTRPLPLTLVTLLPMSAALLKEPARSLTPMDITDITVPTDCITWDTSITMARERPRLRLRPTRPLPLTLVTLLPTSAALPKEPARLLTPMDIMDITATADCITWDTCTTTESALPMLKPELPTTH